MQRYVASKTFIRAGAAESSSATALLVGILAAACCLVLGAYWLSAVGVGVFAYCMARLLIDSGRDLPIESFMLVMASTQWIVGPLLAYIGFSDHYKYRMYVPETEYMALAVPGVLAYAFGLYLPRSRRRVFWLEHYAGVTRELVSNQSILPWYLIGIGVAFSLVVDRLPEAVAFPAYVLSNLKYIGLIYIIFSDRQRSKTRILALGFLLTFASSLRTTMFHDLILWSAFIGMYAAYVLRPSLARKLLLAGLGLLFIFVIQSVKQDYRYSLKSQDETEQVSKFVASLERRFGNEEELAEGNMERLVHRLNQGWIISRIMQNVPASIPHANGETMVVAVKASLLPRLLFPDKPIAGGKRNYEKYTGYQLQIGTSMGISLLGEAYINFGVQGAWIFMFIFGLISSFVIQRLFLLGSKLPTIWLWFPLIMFHFIKAETELLVQLNFLVKCIALVLLFIWANKHFFRLKL